MIQRSGGKGQKVNRHLADEVFAEHGCGYIAGQRPRANWHDGIGYDEQHYQNALRRRGPPLAQRLSEVPSPHSSAPTICRP